MRFEYFSDIYNKKLQFRYTVFRIVKGHLLEAERCWLKIVSKRCLNIKDCK